MKEIFGNFIKSRNDESTTISNHSFVSKIPEKCAEFCSINKHNVTIKEADLKLFFETLIGEPITDDIQNSILNILADNFTFEDVTIIEQSPKSKKFLADFIWIPDSLFKQVCEIHLYDLQDSNFSEPIKFYYAIPDGLEALLCQVDNEANLEIIEGSVAGLLVSTTKRVAGLDILTKPLSFDCIGCLIRNPYVRLFKEKKMMEFEIFISFNESWIKAKIDMNDVSNLDKWIKIFESKTTYTIKKPIRKNADIYNQVLAKITKEAEKNNSELQDSVEFRVKTAFEKFAQENRDFIKCTSSKKEASKDQSGMTICIEGENAYLTYKGVIKPILELIDPINEAELKTILQAKKGPGVRYTTGKQHTCWIVNKECV